MSLPLVALRHYVVDACDGPFGSALKGEHYADDGARVIRLGNVGAASWRDDDAAFIPLSYWRSLTRHHAQEGDVIVAGLGDEGNPVGRACVLPGIGPALVKADCYRLSLDLKQCDPRFVAWYLSSASGLAQSERLADGSTRSRLTLSKTLSLRVPFVAKAVQCKIADYLDAETARIDALIEKKRRMAELLDERRAVVTACGVSGLFTAGDVELSQLPWLPVRGRNWTEAKLTLVARLGTGHTPSREHPEWWLDCTIPWITTGEVSQMRSDRIQFITDTRERISEIGMANSSAELHPAGTVVLCRTASAGYSAIMGTDMATSQDFATWTCGPLLRPRFLLLCLRVMRQDLLGRLAMGSTHQTIYMPDIESIRVPLPPTAEQDLIVETVWERLRQIDRALDVLHGEVQLLTERRQALVTAAVTGELNIPGVAA